MLQLFKRHGLKLTLANLLGNIFYNAVFMVLGLILLILSIPFGITEHILADTDPTELEFSIAIFLVLFYFIFLVLLFVATFYYSAGIYGSALDVVYHDHSSINGFFKNMFKHGFKLVWLFLLISLLMIPIFFILTIIVAIFSLLSFVLGMLLYIFAWFLIMLAFMYSPLLMIHDGLKAWDSIKLSVKIFRLKPGQTFATFGLSLLAYLIALVPFFISFLFFIPAILGGDGVFSILLAVIGGLVLLISSFIATPLSTACSSLVLCYRFKNFARPLIFPDEDPKDFEPSFSFKTDTSY